METIYAYMCACICVRIRLWLGAKPLAHYISGNFQLVTCAQALEDFFWFFSLLPCQRGRGVAVVEDVGWFAFRFQHGRK